MRIDTNKASIELPEEIPKRSKRSRNVSIYPEVYDAVSVRCESLGDISIVEYVNRAVAKVLNITVKNRRRRRYMPGGRLDVIRSTESIFEILELTPLGTKKEGGVPPKPKENV